MSIEPRTNCQYVGNQVYCNSTTTPTRTPAPDPNAFMRGWENSQRIFDAAARARQQQQLIEQQRQEAADETAKQEARAAAAQMVANGQCAEARSMALERGMLSLAGEIRAACGPTDQLHDGATPPVANTPSTDG